MVIWTRIGGAEHDDHRVDWEISTADDGALVSRGSATTGTARAHTLQVDVDGLEPATDYSYTFTSRGESIAGRTRTLPRRAEQFRFVVACCSRWGWPGFERYADIVSERPAVVLHLGDSIYEIGEVPPSGEPTDPPWACHTIDDYRRRYRQHRSHPALQRFHANVPVIAIWDDHEVVDNAPDDDNAARRSAGQRAWREFMPMRQQRDDASVDRSMSIDGLLDLAIVDARFSGRRPNDIDGPGGAGSGAGHLLDTEQWRLLEEFADESTAPWFVVANQVQVGPMTLAARPAVAWPPWRRIVNPDQWDGYPHDRDRLYDVMRSVPGRSVILSGDLHSGWSRTLSDVGHQVAHEFTSPSISGTTYARLVRQQLPIPPRLLTAWLRTINRGIGHLDLVRHGYLVCDVTPQRFTTTFVTNDGARHEISLSTA